MTTNEITGALDEVRRILATGPISAAIYKADNALIDLSDRLMTEGARPNEGANDVCHSS